MKKLLSFLLVVGLFVLFTNPVYPQREQDWQYDAVDDSTTELNVVNTVGGDIYWVSMIAHTATATFCIYNADSTTEHASTNAVFEGAEATNGEGHFYDFSEHPIVLDDGIFVHCIDCYVNIGYK